MAFEELKQKQSAMWGAGPFERVESTITQLHDAVFEQLAPHADGAAWLDVGCGTGALALRAARTGADVTGIDLAPALIETAKQRAEEEGVSVDFRVGDVERLDGIDDTSFDLVSSTVGVMFAPDHAASARQLARVTKPGGRLCLANWTLEGGIGRMFGMMRPFQPPPPEGAGSPFAWGDPEYVERLLGGDFELKFEKRMSSATFDSPEAYWQLMVESYGPTKALAESLGDRREELHRTWVDFYGDDRYARDGHIEEDREYLLTTGIRR
jgi:SAM-dependent methyltransferase